MEDEYLETLRRRFKPEKIRLLLVGESPPRRGFFYDCLKETFLSRATREAFEEAYGVKYLSKLSFLEDFKHRGCYLIDLFSERGRKALGLAQEEKEDVIKRLSSFIQEEEPRYVIGVLKRIGGIVIEAAKRSHVQLKAEVIPFPIGKYKRLYKDRLKELLLKEG